MSRFPDEQKDGLLVLRKTTIVEKKGLSVVLDEKREVK